MKRITLPKIRRALETLRHEVTIDPGIAATARRSVERMLAVR
jgi:quinolinate synthase